MQPDDSLPLYVQIAESLRRRIASGELEPGDKLPPVREMARRWGCTPGTVNRAYAELGREGLVSGQRGGGTRVAPNLLQPERPTWRWATLVNRAERFLLEAIGSGHGPEEAQAALSVALARWQEATQPTAGQRPAPREAEGGEAALLRFVGSHDLVVERLAETLHRGRPGVDLELQYMGSLGGLMALARGEADLAGAHLWDDRTDTYNVPYVQRIFPGQPIALLTLAHRRLGLLVAPDNPRQIGGLRDLTKPGVAFVNRQQGSGTRVWLDAQLRALSVDPGRVAGYDAEEITHLGVARAVAKGRATAGLGIQAAALAYGLGFVPLTLERYDLVIPEAIWQRPTCQALVEVVRSPDFLAAVEAVGGYETGEIGQVQWVRG
ncbi:MAG: substrate-binding domain-containing protein [Anaerolineae bacterium]